MKNTTLIQSHAEGTLAFNTPLKIYFESAELHNNEDVTITFTNESYQTINVTGYRGNGYNDDDFG